MKRVVLVLSGMFAGVLAAVLAVPRVLAQGAPPAPPAVRWQQFCEPAASISEASSIAGARGAEGWELVGFFGGALCFKRPVPTQASAPVSAASPPRPPSVAADTSWPGY
jgi:hypothetical protein